MLSQELQNVVLSVLYSRHGGLLIYYIVILTEIRCRLRSVMMYRSCDEVVPLALGRCPRGPLNVSRLSCFCVMVLSRGSPDCF